MPHPESDHGTPVGDLISLVELIQEPQLARVYTYVRRRDSTSVSEISSNLGIPERTAYDYVNTLEDAGSLQATTATRPVTYTADAIELTLQADGETQAITPEFVGAIARRETDEDIDVYLDKHGVSTVMGPSTTA